jgi:hypothetical protein
MTIELTLASPLRLSFSKGYHFPFNGVEKTDEINGARNDNENGSGFKIRGWEGLKSRNS